MVQNEKQNLIRRVGEKNSSKGPPKKKKIFYLESASQNLFFPGECLPK